MKSVWILKHKSRRLAVMAIALTCFSTIVSADYKLFFSSADLPALRDKATREPYASMWNTVKALADAHPNDSYQTYNTPTNAMNNAFAYLMTGNTVYADRAKNYCTQMVNDTNYWAVDSSKGLTRAILAQGVAVCYDFCKSGWDSTTDTLMSAKLRDMGDSLMRNGGSGYNGDPQSNWVAIRYSAAGMCYLASDTPSTSFTVDAAYNGAASYMAGALSTRADSRGWAVEPLNYVQYPAYFYGAFAQAMRRANPSKDLMNSVPGAKYAEFTTMVATTPILRTNGYRGWYPDTGDGTTWGSNSNGNTSFLFANSPPEYQAGLKWQFDHIFGAQGDQKWNQGWGGAIFSFLDYPENVVAKNPEQVWGRTYHDPVEGVTMFRNKYNDTNDFIALYKAKSIDPASVHAGCDGNSIRIIGLNTEWVTGDGTGGSSTAGQTTTFNVDPSTNPYGWHQHGNRMIAVKTRPWGDGYEIGQGDSYSDCSDTGVMYPKRIFVTDYSRLSGADAVFVISDASMDGTWWRLNTPEFNSMALTSDGFVLTSPDGHKMYGTVLWGDTNTLRTGTFRRSTSIAYNGRSYYNNKWVDLQSSDAKFVVVLTVMANGAACPTITHTGTGVNQTITIGNEVITLNGYNINVKSWDLQATNIGDANYDNTVDVVDLGVLSGRYGTTGNQWIDADFNGDGIVNVIDLGILASNYGHSYTGFIPEPAGLIAMLLGTAVLNRLKEKRS